MLKVLEIIATGMQALNINYEFEEWTSDIAYPYFIGEYEETGGASEDGLSESVFMLTGTTRGSWLDLEGIKAQIESYFKDYRTIASNGNGIVIDYAGSFPVQTGEEALKRVQINLNIKEWKVN